ncbi:pentatricopeptide repeat-containing protein At3g57430, chloroplastic-like isoform X1 [Arachis ipaensis]|uniref:pentatricopeptide repeat-containing protein At3g57430, chloroplastic-like isoform X1 n=2 Tax=Arachis ipaensis TaxID=130454 RepID=UPI0007AFD8FE|nr:pentatricopeptide repeat-containing protein At3g57430, chloroplastic-like isoform X1 [Arachis ipaensis]
MCRNKALKLSILLRNCVRCSAVLQVKQCHAQTILQGLLPHLTLQTDLLLAYCRLCLLRHARKVFGTMPIRNMHSWNIMIASYIENSLYSNALAIFREFKSCNLVPDHYTLPQLFKACVGVGDACFGKVCHGWVIKLGYEGYVVVASSVLEFYVKFGLITEAYSVYSMMLCRDFVAWNLMISGFLRAGLYLRVIDCFREMLLTNGGKMDSMSVPSILIACGREGDLMKGKEVHGYVFKNCEFDVDTPIGNTLIDMYGKCGCLNDSEKVFKTMRSVNVVTWTTMISCYGMHGNGEEALFLFRKMVNGGITPNSVTLTAVLASCSHSGLIDQGKKIFNSISSSYGLQPSAEHYACMVDLFGRAGYLVEALELLRSMKSLGTGSVWGALLAGCVMHKNVEIAEIAAHHLFQLEPNNASNYIALCGIYQSHGMLDGIATVRERMREQGLIKTPGCSWISIGGRAHKFYQGDLSQPLSHLIERITHQISNTQLLDDDFGSVTHDDTCMMAL